MGCVYTKEQLRLDRKSREGTKRIAQNAINELSCLAEELNVEDMAWLIDKTIKHLTTLKKEFE